MDAARTLRDARRRAGLTQRALASRTGTPQPAIARIERGTVVPRVDTLDRLLAGCGEQLGTGRRPGIGVDRTAIRALLRLTPVQRLRVATREGRNLERLAAALRQLHAELRGADRDAPFLLDAKTLAAGDHFTLMTDAGNLDILGTPAGVEGFDALEREAKAFELDGLTIPVASIEDLISMKLAAGRPKDLIEVEVLGAVRDEAELRGEPHADPTERMKEGRP